MATRKGAGGRKKVVVPKTREIDGKVVPFNPSRVALFLEVNAVEYIFESLGFWFSRLAKLRCPKCSFGGTLEVFVVKHGIEIECSRVKCDYLQEVSFEEDPR